MARPSRADQSCLRDVAETLRTLRLDDPGTLTQALERLRTATNGQMTALYRAAYLHETLAVEFAHAVGDGRATRPFSADFEEFVGQMGPPSILYDPIRPEPAQRNVVLIPFDEVLPGRPQAALAGMTALAARQHFDVEGQVRVLICDGPLLLGWFGGAWPKAERARAKRLLGALVSVVRERLLLERTLSHTPLLAASLQTTLEALAVPAFITGNRAGNVEIHATNAAGAAALDRPGGETYQALASAVLHPEARSRFRIRPITGAGLPEYQLVVERRPLRAQEKVDAAASHFELTPRQHAVLELLVLGHTNRTISELLGCAQSTVEVHVSAMLDKVGCDSRSQLVAQVWMLDED